MFIMTANANPLDVDDDDRRIYYISTPTAMINTPQVKSSSIDTIVRAITNQTEDIAYWLATEVGDLSAQDYTTAPKHKGREGIIFSGKNVGDKIAWALTHDRFDLLEDFLDDVAPIFTNKDKGVVDLDDLVSVYMQMVNSDDPKGRMRSAMSNMGYKTKKTTRGGKTNILYYYLPHIKDYVYAPIDEDGEEVRL
jgi:hypothetical protein